MNPVVARYGRTWAPADAQRPGLVTQWEAAYRAYGEASEHAARSVAGDPDAAEAVAAASWQVASLWRDIATSQEVPWWVLAALRAAAEVFEQQARDWQARAQHSRSAPASPVDNRRRGRSAHS